MKVTIDIPKEYEKHFNDDRFEYSLKRVRCDCTEMDDTALSSQYDLEVLDMLIEAIKDGLSSAQKTSKWVAKSSFVNNDYVCQNCGAYLGDVSNASNVTLFKYCYNCGAEMEVNK